jgi:hypothetical protein
MNAGSFYYTATVTANSPREKFSRQFKRAPFTIVRVVMLVEFLRPRINRN